MGKKNFNSIPEHIRVKLAVIETDLIEVCTIEKINAKNIKDYEKLGFKFRSDEIEFTKNPLLPLESWGRYSKYNIKGRTIIRKDLPKVTTDIPYELQDWGGYWHTGTYQRFVYQREFWEPKFLNLEFTPIKQMGTDFLVKISVEGILNKAQKDFEFELLYRCNLLQECAGNCDIYAAQCTKEDYMKIAYIDWEIFPPGELSLDKLYESIPNNTQKPSKEEFKDRLETILKANPVEMIHGAGQFRSYIGAKFANGKVAFENSYWGNALYVVHKNWEEISKQSRSELMRLDPTKRDFTRIVHNKKWKDNFFRAIK